MKGDKVCSMRARISESMKVRVQVYMIKHNCSESEVMRRALQKFLQTNVAKARQIITNNSKISTPERKNTK